MRRCWPAILVLLAGCDGPRFWKDRYLQEVNYHYQTQQIKNAEIAARELEIENQKSYIVILEDRIRQLDERVARLEASRKDPPPGAAGKIQATVTAVANEVVVFSVGREGGAVEGMEFWITREGETIGKALVDRVDAKWSAAKLKERRKDPKVGDAAVNQAP